jgi:hypothetical protein
MAARAATLVSMLPNIRFWRIVLKKSAIEMALAAPH